MEAYVPRAQELFSLLHRSVLARDVPFPLRPAQLRQYVDLGAVTAVFHGLHVHFEATGSPVYGLKPQVLIYPVLIVERDDGVLITVSSCGEGISLGYTKVRAEEEDDEDLLRLDGHLAEVHASAQQVLDACQEELGEALVVAPLDRFPGFPTKQNGLQQIGRRMVVPLNGHHDEWLMATGTRTHYLTATPQVDPCRFHTWAACRVEDYGIGVSALSVRSVNPRAVFIDTQPHHCAHQLVQDRRESRCHIMSIDQRTCCQACAYVNGCWDVEEQANLPCGR